MCCTIVEITGSWLLKLHIRQLGRRLGDHIVGVVCRGISGFGSPSQPIPEQDVLLRTYDRWKEDVGRAKQSGLQYQYTGKRNHQTSSGIHFTANWFLSVGWKIFGFYPFKYYLCDSISDFTQFCYKKHLSILIEPSIELYFDILMMGRQRGACLTP